jgi:hypothetical protein
MNNTTKLIQLAERYNETYNSGFEKFSFVRKLPNGKWRVVSRKGKNLGTYNTKEEAKKRLKRIEYFKHQADDGEDKAIDLTDIDDYSYSAIMRKMRNKASKEQVREFLKIFKSYFDKAVKNKLQKPEKVALQNSLVKFNKLYPIKLNKKMIKSAAISELGDPAQVGQYLANIVRFVLARLQPDQKNKAMETLRAKFQATNADELAQKTSPPTAGIGQSITFVKHVLFNQSPLYIREVLNNLSRNLF